MRAVVVREFGPVDAHRVEEFPDPAAGPGQVLINVAAVALNFSDRLLIQGIYQVKPDRPFVPGRDAAGVTGTCFDVPTWNTKHGLGEPEEWRDPEANRA